MHINAQKLKYPLYLFLAILFAKLGYIVIESYYNYHVLTVTTDPSLTRESIEELNRNGHRISAAGITLLLIPHLYRSVKQFSQKVMLITLFVLSLLTYFLSYQSLNYIVDEIVEINKEKRHDAYYIDIFKYGVLNNIFTYDSFVDSKKIKENNIDVDDKILLTNTFLLLQADETVITKLKERGKSVVADLYIRKYLQDDYNKKFNEFNISSSEISKQWNLFNDKRNQLNEELKSLEDESFIKSSYTEMKNDLTDSYAKYLRAWQKVGSRIREETFMPKVSEMKKKLNNYFFLQHYPQAKEKYKEEMNAHFGHYIEPSRWKDEENHVTHVQIIKVIKEEIRKKAKHKIGNLPSGLSVKEFMYHDITKKRVAQALKKKDILIPYDFDYSYNEFHRYFDIMTSKKRNNAYETFYNKLEKEIGKNDLKLSMGWKEYIYSAYIQGKIKEKIKLDTQDDLDQVSLALLSKDLANFKKMIYLPPIMEKVNSKMYAKNEFKDGGKATQDGDDAIKLLYIPPFALAVSIVALLLNIITVLEMILSSFGKLSTIKIHSIKIGFIIIIILTPFMFSNQKFDRGLLKEAKQTHLSSYITFLHWISFYEKLNYSLHNK